MTTQNQSRVEKLKCFFKHNWSRWAVTRLEPIMMSRSCLRCGAPDLARLNANLGPMDEFTVSRPLPAPLNGIKSKFGGGK